jgi:uncharacterized membrane protein YphA (DoxX/SURF4 family)
MNNLYPLAEYTDIVLTLARVMVGIVMVYFGLPKIKNLRANAKDFVGMGLKPGWLWGSVVVSVEFFGGILMLIGWFVSPVAILFGIEMAGGTIWKITKAKKKFSDYSYDLLLLTLCLLFLTFGGGMALF